MPAISKSKKDKISEQILALLFEQSPNSIFTSKIAESIIRDEEFTKVLLQDLEGKKLVVKVTKNSQGEEYARRERWRLSNQAFDVYKQHQR